MTLGTMKIWRLLIPAALIILYGSALLYVIDGIHLDSPDWTKAPYLPLVLVPAVLYYVTPLRDWINKGSHARIAENIRSGLVKIAGYEDDREKYSWDNLRPLFFKLIDDDKTLATKASLAYFNGLIWTSFADSGVISLIYGLISILLYYFGAQNALAALAMFVAIMVISIIGNRVATNRQIQIGNEQLDHIKFEQKAAVERRLNQLDR